MLYTGLLQRRCAWYALWILLLNASPLPADQPQRGDELREVIENLVANEELYHDIEAIVETTFEYVGPKDEDYHSEELDLIRSQHGRNRYVSQGPLVYYHDDGRTVSAATDSEAEYWLGYDGELTRVNSDNDFINVHQGRFGNHVLRPHKLVWSENFGRRLRLSELLTANRIGRCQRFSAFYDGRESVQGIDCVRVRGEMFFRETQPEPDVCYFWLAPERNYLPIRYVVYNPRYSMRVPIATSSAQDLREIAPGIWFPFSVVHVSNHQPSLWEDREVPMQRRELKFTTVKLDPDYDISLFRDIPIPDGRIVRVLSDGEVVRSYWQGGPPNRKKTVSGISPWIVLLTITAAASVALVLLRHYRRRQMPTDATTSSTESS